MDSVENRITALIELASQQERASGVAEILRYIAESLESAACLLWQVAPHAQSDTNQFDRLHVVAHWVKDGPDYASHDLPAKSITGTAIQSGESITVPISDQRVHKDWLTNQPYLKWMCSAPLQLSPGVPGALNVYRDGSNAFSEMDIGAMNKFARVLPTLYQLIREKSAFALIGKVRELVEKAEREASAAPELLQAVCKVVSEHFSCVETSIFLENHLTKPGVFELEGGTRKEYLRQNSYRMDEPGLTPWVLGRKRPVKIFDLAHFERDLGVIQDEYPELTWRDDVKIDPATRTILKLPEGAPLPPFSFMAVPVLTGDSVLGAIRCCTATRAPFYFSSADVALLQVVASQVGHFWKSWLTGQELKNELASWRKFGEDIRSLNVLALDELERHEPDGYRIYQAGLRIAARIIPGADILDVRLHDPDDNSLYFFAEYGDAWKRGSETEVRERKAKRYPIGAGPGESAGAWVFRNDRVRLIPDVSKDTFYSSTFPAVKRMIISPISPIGSQKKKYGVLDIRSTGTADFPRQAESMTVLVGQQLGLYHFLATAIREQALSYQDLEHQLRSPIRQALERLSEYLFDMPEGERPRPLRAVRGLLRKSFGIANSLAMFSTLHKGEKLPINRSPLTESTMAKALLEQCSDNRLLYEEEGIRAQVDRPSLAVLQHHEVEVDLELLEQAINNIVDNAFKYSDEGSTIEISCGMRGRLFYISVRNQGISLTQEELEQVTIRGWRSKKAKSVAPLGSGIGLWLVDNILKAHGGTLEITPTTNGYTEFKLLFPSK